MTHEQRWDTLGRGGGPERPKERPFFEITPARRLALRAGRLGHLSRQ